MPLKAIVFDFDGVLANSEPLHCLSFQRVLASESVHLSDEEYYARYLGFDDVGVFRAIASDRAIAWDARRIADLVAMKALAMEELERDGSVLFPGAADAIRRAAAAVPIAIASGAIGPEIRRTLDREQLTPLFAAIVAAEDTRRSKPAPDPYLLAVDRLGTVVRDSLDPGECLAIEDSRWGLESARAAGLKTVAVGQTYDVANLPADLAIDSIAALDLHLFASLFTR
ncbi:MAG TPA: HAD family phosphatase [Vicinamibacterales bacterium]|nr:HAD family phosphatase [Vicinamibacterales bacterium]